jgi:hypothetical protein
VTGHDHRSIVSPFALYFNVQLIFFKFQVRMTHPASIAVDPAPRFSAKRNDL